MVASPGIEPGSGASETLILSIVRRGLKNFRTANVEFRIEINPIQFGITNHECRI